MTALAVVVNEAVATASATVAGAAKRRDSFTSSQEHARAGTDMLRRFSRDNYERWIASDRNSGLVKPTAPPDSAKAYPLRLGGIDGSLAGTYCRSFFLFPPRLQPKQDGDMISKHFLCNVWKKRSERPNVGGRSRNSALPQKGCVVDGQITKASNK